MKKQNCFLVVVFLFFMASCSSEQSGETFTVPSDKGNIKQAVESSNIKSEKYFLDIAPKDADKNSMFGLTAKGFYLNDAKIEWLVNGNKISDVEKYYLKAEKLKKGDTVKAVAIVKDIRIESDLIKIKNALPQINQLTFESKRVEQGTKMGVNIAASDVDEDKVTFIYKWRKNGEPAGSGSSIDLDLKRGDKVELEVIPFDGEDYGVPRFLRTEIYNFLPRIESLKYEKGSTFYRIKAVDPDGDALTYNLKQGPPGISIEKSTGLVKWDRLIDYKGKVVFTVSVVDSYGGEATQEFTLEIE